MDKVDVAYQDQSASALRLNVIYGPLNMGQFNLLDHGQFSGKNFAIDLWVIGASHVIKFQLGDKVFHEVFACTEVVSSDKRLFYGPLAGLSEDIRLTEGFLGVVDYKFGYMIRDIEKAQSVITDLQAGLKAGVQSNKFGALYVFPRAAEGGFDPLTVVCGEWMLSEEEIHVQSVHAYPNEGKAVYTKTIVSLKNLKQTGGV
jgi:hypothetical protein